jgi:hypothetical protein
VRIVHGSLPTIRRPLRGVPSDIRVRLAASSTVVLRWNVFLASADVR